MAQPKVKKGVRNKNLEVQKERRAKAKAKELRKKGIK